MTISKPKNWDNTEAAPFGFKRVKPDGYILKVIHAGDILTPKTKKPAIVIYCDIAQGEFKGYYQELTNRLGYMIALDKMQLITEDETNLKYYKRFVQFFEECNQGFKFDFRPPSLVGKFIGGVVGEEEYLCNKDHVIKIKLKIQYLCPISTIVNKEFRIPPLKKYVEEKEKEPEPENDYSSFFDENTSFDNGGGNPWDQRQ